MIYNNIKVLTRYSYRLILLHNKLKTDNKPYKTDNAAMYSLQINPTKFKKTT